MAKYIGQSVHFDDFNMGTPSVFKMNPVCLGVERNCPGFIKSVMTDPSCKSTTIPGVMCRVKGYVR